MSTFVGRRTAPKQPAPEKPAAKPAQAEAAKEAAKPDKTRAELVEEAEDLGIEVPKGATKAQIQKIIDEAPVM